MPKILSPLGIIQEEDASNIFYAILRLNEAAQPSDIAKDVGRAPSSVTDNLKKLRMARIVNAPQKEGRKMYYTINWKNFARLAIRRYRKESILFHLLECEGISEAERPSKEELLGILKKLESNIDFERFLQTFFIKVANDDLMAPDSIGEALDDIELEIVEWKKIKGESEFKSTLRKWGKQVSKHEQVTKKAFWEAIKEV